MNRFLSSILIFIIIFQTINDTFFVDYFGSNSLKITVTLFVIFFIRYFFSFQYFIKINKIVIIYLLTILLSLTANSFRLYNSADSFFALIIVLTYFVIFSQYKDIKWIIFSIIVSVLFSSIYCYTRDDVISEWSFRKTGGMGDPNEFSTTILIALGLIWSYYLAHKKYLYYIVLFTFIFILALIAAGSKTAFVALIIYILVIAYIIIINSKRSQKIRSFLILAISIISGVIFIDYYFESEIELFFNRFEDNRTADQRFMNWENGVELFKDNWFFGVGPQNYSNVLGTFNSNIEEHARETHNMHLKTLFELGIFGFIFWILLMIKMLRYFMKNNHYSSLLISMSYLLMGMTLSLTFDKYVWMVIGISLNPYFISFFKKNLLINYNKKQL